MEKIIHKFTGKATIGGIEYLAKVIRIYFSELDGSELLESMVSIIDNVIDNEVKNESFTGGIAMDVDEFISINSWGHKVEIISHSHLQEAKTKGKANLFSQQIRFSDEEETFAYINIVKNTSGNLRRALRNAFYAPDLLASTSYINDAYAIAMLPYNAREWIRIHSQDYYKAYVLNKYPVCGHIRYNELIEISTDIILLKEHE